MRGTCAEWRKGGLMPPFLLRCLALIVLSALSFLSSANAQESIFVTEVPVIDPPVSPPKEEETPLSPPRNDVSTPAATPRLNFVERSDDELVLVSLAAGNVTLADSLSGYAAKGRLLLPLGAFAEALEFPVRISARDGIAEGWMQNENQRLNVDAARREAVVGGEKETLQPEQIEPHEDDIYVDSTVLARWFSLELNFSFNTQTVNIKPKRGHALPFQLAAERDRKRASLKSADAEKKPARLIREPYHLATMPFADINASTNYDQRNNSTLENNVSAQVTHDFLYMHSNAYISAGSEQGVEDLRWNLSRKDPEGKIFAGEDSLEQSWLGEASNALEIREISFGDIYAPQLPLTARNQSGVGVLISSQPEGRATLIDRTSLEGTILLNWEVELYRNDELLAFQRASETGRYEFPDIPLLSGLNILRLVFYGPSGETREETERIMVNSDMTKPGKTYFRFGAMRQDNNIFDVRENFTSSFSVLGNGTPSQQEAIRGDLRSFVEIETGLLPGLSATAQATHLPTLDGDSRNYATFGLAGSLWGIYARVDGSKDDNGGQAGQATLQTSLLGATLSGRYQQFDDFISDFTGDPLDPVTRRMSARTDAPIKLSWFPRLNLGVSAGREEYDSGRRLDEFDQRLSTNLFGLMALSNALRWQVNTSETDDITRQTLGDMVASLPVYSFFLRGSAQYSVTPEKTLNLLALSADKMLLRSLTARGEVSKQMIDDKLTTYTLGLTQRFERFQLGANASYADDGNMVAGLNLTLSVGQDPRSGQWRSFAEPMARTGLISARAFVDEDRSAGFTDGDTSVSGARFTVENTGWQEPAGMEGTTLLKGISTEQPATISLDESSLQNPSWVTGGETIAVIARPGVPVMLDLPVSESGEIEGKVEVESKSGAKEPARNVILELLDNEGILQRDIRTASDGTYVLDRVPLGRYSLRVSPDQLKRRNYTASEALAIDIVDEESVLTGKDFVVTAAP